MDVNTKTYKKLWDGSAGNREGIGGSAIFAISGHTRKGRPMEVETGKNYYEEIEASPVAQVGVQDVSAFIRAMLDLFRNEGTLYISSYDFGYWDDKLASFRSGDRVKLIASLPDPAFLENGYTLTDEFIYVFSIDCLNNIDPRSVFNQFLIYRNGEPLLQCCGNFEDVYLNVEVPQRVVKDLARDNVISFWK